MSVRLMPLSHNALTVANQADQSTYCKTWRGFSAANSLDTDIAKPVLINGAFTHGGAQFFDFDEGAGELNASVPDVTWQRIPDACADAAAAMNAVGTAGYKVYICQDSTNRNRAVVSHPSVSFTLPIKTGTYSGADNFLFRSLGFRNADRASAQTHVGDYAVLSGDGLRTQLWWEFDSVSGNTLNYKAIQAVVLVNPVASPNLQVGYIDGSADFIRLPMDYDSQLMACFLDSTLFDYRFYLVLQDRYSEDSSSIGVGYVYAGPYYEPPATNNWSWSALSMDTSMRIEVTPDTSGTPFLSALEPGMRFALEFASPGLSPTDADAFASVIQSLGRYERVFVAMDPNEPNRETALCRITSAPTLARRSGWSKIGRWNLRLDMEILRW